MTLVVVLGSVYAVPNQYRCVPEIVADTGSVYTENACTVAFYATEQQYITTLSLFVV